MNTQSAAARRAGRLASLDARLYLVTDTEQCLRAGRSVSDTVYEAVAGGVGIVQIREKRLGDEALHRLTLEAVRAAEAGRRERAARPVPVFVNDRVELAADLIEAGLPVGLHIGQDDGDPAAVRARIGEDALLGLSAAEPEEIARAAGQPVDLLGVGPVWDTGTKPDAPAGLGVRALHGLVARAPRPCVAIGGITIERAAGLRSAQLLGVCVVSAICAAADPRAAASALLTAFDPSRRGSTT